MPRIDAVLLGIILLAAAVQGTAAYGFEARDQLNINTARAEELAEVPGITPETAQNIVVYRQAHGPFTSIDDLLKVTGMEKKMLEKARMYLSVESQTHLE